MSGLSNTSSLATQPLPDIDESTLLPALLVEVLLMQPLLQRLSHQRPLALQDRILRHVHVLAPMEAQLAVCDLVPEAKAQSGVTRLFGADNVTPLEPTDTKRFEYVAREEVECLCGGWSA